MIIDYSVSDVMITCRTPPISGADSFATIHIEYDSGGTRHLPSFVFTYLDNPVVTDVTPTSSYRR